MELLSFNQFINEGVYLGKDDKAHLSFKDDPRNPAEVLKTVDHGRYHFKDTLVNNKKDNALWAWTWPVFWAMGPDGAPSDLDHPGRIKYTMNKVKNAEINDIDNALPDFIRQSFMSLGITRNFRPDYVVTVGSQAGLVNSMANAINKTLGSDIKIIELPKVVYLSALDAFDWDEVNRQVDLWGEKTFNKVKSTIYNYVDKEETPKPLIQAIKDSKTISELKELLHTVGISWRAVVGGEATSPFILRSSGRTSGGSRSMWKNKYDYQTTSFIEAVIDCAVNGSRMLIIDDNRHTGTDSDNIRQNIEEIVSGLDRVKGNPSNRYGFYVLYRIPASGKYTDSKGNSKKLLVDQDTVNSFIEFIRGSRDNAQVEDNLEETEDK